jgi:outer membrane protein insertion porin family
MFGLLGFDYGIGFDKTGLEGLSLKNKGTFNIILGFEPD